MKQFILKNKKIFLTIVIFIHIFFSFHVWRTEISNVKDKSSSAFQNKVNTEANSVQSRLEVYADILYSVRGMFAQNPEKIVSKDSWDLYIDSLKTFDRYPGVTNIYFIRYVNDAELSNYIQIKQAEYSNVDTNFSTNNFLANSNHYIISLVYPFENNTSNIGTDIITDSSISDELDLARDRGVPTTTSLNYFTQDILDKTQINILLPLYKNYTALDTVEERRSSLEGFVTMTFDLDKLIENVFSTSTDYSDEIELEIYDISEIKSKTTENLIYESNELTIEASNFLEKELTMEFGGKSWAVVFKAQDTYQSDTGSLNAHNISFLLMLLSGFLLIYIAYQFTERN